MIAFHSGDNCVPHGRSDATTLQSSLLAIGGIKPNSKYTPVDTARWYHDRLKLTSQTSMWACRKAKPSSKSSSVTSPNYSISFLEPSTIVTEEKHNCLTTVYSRYGSAVRCRWPGQLDLRLADSVCSQLYPSTRQEIVVKPAVRLLLVLHLAAVQRSSKNLWHWVSMTDKGHGTLGGLASVLHQMMNVRCFLTSRISSFWCDVDFDFKICHEKKSHALRKLA